MAQQQNVQKTNTLAIIGLILAFIVPLLGLILSIVGLSQINKHHQEGKGLAIAGIVISSILTVLSGFIFMALVLASFSGVQNKARDTERTTDIKAIHSQVEAYYSEKGYYPTLANLNDPAWRAGNLVGLDQEALVDPKRSGMISSSPAASVYSYEARPNGCNNQSIKCTKYVLTATLEDGTIYTKEALN
jgi:hypothetical protein